MEKDVLIILMIAFGLFAVIMFVLFYVYLKKYYNSRRISDDFEKEIDNRVDDDDDEDIIGNSGTFEDELNNNENYPSTMNEYNVDNDDEFVPMKKE